MTPEAVIAVVLSFLVGSVGTAFGYTVKFNGQISALNTKVDSLIEAARKPIIMPQDITDKLAKVCNQAEEHARRLDKLESLLEKH